MKRPVIVTVSTLVAAVILTACGGSNATRDVEGVPSKDPDSIAVYNNVDQYPNIVKVCIEGAAFATTTRQYQPVQRVPEWDKTCPGAVSK